MMKYKLLQCSIPENNSNIVVAKLLLPVNNPNHFVIKTLSGQVKAEVVATYVYNSDGYPTSATFTSTSEGDVSVSAATYTYQP